jgi:protein-disulfide isomerase
MSSRKSEKEQRRRERLEAETAAQQESRRKRLIAGLSAAAAAAIVVVVALVVISQSGGDEGGEVSGSEGAAAVEGLPQSGARLGAPNAEVTIHEFADLQCPACAQFSKTIVPELISRVVEPGDAALEFRQFVILGPDSLTAARAALAAGEQDRLWQYVEVFYENQGSEGSGYVTDELLADIAREAGVPDIERWESDRQDPRWDEQIATDETEALDQGFQGTPSILVEGPGGEEALGTVRSANEIEQAIERVR